MYALYAFTDVSRAKEYIYNALVWGVWKFIIVAA